MTFWRLYYNIKARFLEHLKKKINIHLGKLKKFDISIPWHHTLLCCLSTICIKLSRAWVGQGAEHSALNSNGQMYSNVQRGWLGLDNDILTSAINPPGVEVSANIMGVGARPLCHYIRHSQGCENATSEKVIQLKSYYFKMIEMRYLFNIHTILYLHTAYWNICPSLPGFLSLMACVTSVSIWVSMVTRADTGQLDNILQLDIFIWLK